MYLLRSAEDKPPGQHSLGENGLIPKPGSCSWREQWPTQPQIYTRVHTLLLLILLKHTFCPFRMKVTLISLVTRQWSGLPLCSLPGLTHSGSKHCSSPCTGEASRSTPLPPSDHEDTKLKSKTRRMSREIIFTHHVCSTNTQGPMPSEGQRPWVKAGAGLEPPTHGSKQTFPPKYLHLWCFVSMTEG